MRKCTEKMPTKAENMPVQAENRIRRSTLITVICDVILILLLVIYLLTYISINNKRIYEQNIGNMMDIAVVKSELLQSALDNSSHEIKAAYRYCSGRDIADVLDYLSIICEADSDYQLLKYEEANSTDLFPVYSGYSTKKIDGSYQAIEYKDTALSRSIYKYSTREPGEICFSQGFTSKTDTLRYFAVFCGIEIMEDGVLQSYYLIRPQRENTVLNLLQTYSQYSELGTAICYSDGKYIAKDNAFRADNFYDYLYNYNGLSIDERDTLKETVQKSSSQSGYLEYLDYKQRDCIFTYAVCGDIANWYVIVSVPMSQFVASQLLSFFPMTIIIFLAVLLAFNIWRLLIIVNQLRLSVEREKIANASKGTFLSRMSHEIRTPLNAVIGYNTMARSEMMEAEETAEYKQASVKVLDCLQKSDIASRHLLTIINDVLDMSAIESGKIKIAYEQFDFKGLITSLTTVFYSQAQAKGVSFQVLFDTPTDEWFIGDQIRTNQIFTNIISNAIKFTPESGSVKMMIRQLETDDRTSKIRFEISDTGMGMTQEYLDRIWAPFEQADASISRRFGGNGLGLSITKNFVDLMGGEISVESTIGSGTTFYVDLTFDRAEQPQNVGAHDFSEVNALVIDSDVSTCSYIQMLLNRCGAKCAYVTSGLDAVKAITVAIENEEPYSVCLVNSCMPERDGVKIVQDIQSAAGERLPLIIPTANDYSELADVLAAAGGDKYMIKPVFQSVLFDLFADISGEKQSTSKQRKEETNFAGKRILLAEDNAMNMEVARFVLEAANLEVDSAWNGKEAVEMFENSKRGTYMAVLMDVHMPEMDGYEATTTIRASMHPEAKTIPIIAMTADAFTENVAEALAAGMNAHITKPIDISILYETLEKYAL